jgi:hypothetical protein
VPRIPLALAFALALSGCDEAASPSDEPAREWTLALEGLPGALLSVWGTSASDVWAVGGDARDGTGPLVVHYDGAGWTRRPTGQTAGDLWWVHGFADGSLYLGGTGGVILRYEGGRFTKMDTPGTATVFGLWGASPDDMWAVGGEAGAAGFIWRLQGDVWTPQPGVPADAAIWKVSGRGADDVRFVGEQGVTFRWDGATLAPLESGARTSLFTVHAGARRYVAVGGQVSGVILEDAGDGWKTVLGSTDQGLTGVWLRDDDTGYAVGQYGSVYARDAEGWHEEDHGLALRADLHAVWIDPGGGVWAVGGQTASQPLTDGVLIHLGETLAGGGI